MSSQSMKYHELPSFETLVAYKKGDLSAVDSKWIEQLIHSNAMVRAVVENASAINQAAVKSISKRTSESIAKTYYAKAGFWSKYGVWIGLSSITLLIGFTYLYQSLKADALYVQTALNMNNSSEYENDSKNNFSKENAVLFGSKLDDDEQKTPIKGSSKDYSEVIEESTKPENKKALDHEIMTSVQQNKENQFGSTVLNAFEKLENSEKQFKQTEDNTRTFAAESKSSSKTIVLSVQQVQILAKTNPNDFSSSSKRDNKGNPLQGFGQKPGNNSSYSIDDVPKYPGGDRALQNYFVGKLRPIKIQEKDNQYDKSVMLDLEINARGKLKDYKVYGQLHPDHQKALIKAIEELPRFDKGTENITYSLGIAF